MAALAHGIGGSLKIAAIFSVLAFVAVLLLVPKGILHADRGRAERLRRAAPPAPRVTPARRPPPVPPPRALSYTVLRSQGARREAPRRGVRAGLRSATGNRVGGVDLPRGFESLPLRHHPPRVRRETRGAAGTPARRP